MFKKVTITTALAASVLVGGTMQSEAHAQSQQPQTQTFQKTFQLESGQKLNHEQIDKWVNQFLSNYDVQWNKVEQPTQNEQPKQEAPTQKEQPKQEATKQEEQPKQEAPTQEATAPQQQQPATEQQQPQEQQASELSQFEQKVVELTNEERAAQGLEPLKIDKELSNVAEKKSEDMAQNGYFSHNSPTYGSPFEMMKQFGVDYRTAGENIAKGQQTPQEVVDAWMNSEGHRANIMNENFTHIGVGFVEDGNVWTQQFIGK